MILRFGIAMSYAGIVLSLYKLEIIFGVGVLHVLLGMVLFLVRPYREKWMSYTDGIVLTLIGILVLTLPLKNKILYFVYIIIGLSAFFCSAIFILFKCLRKVFMSSRAH